MTTSVIQPIPANLPDKRKTPGLSPVLRKDVASNGPAGLPVVLVLGSFAAVAYADHLVVAISLVYLYLLPLALGAIFLRKEISYGLIAICILFHDYYSPRDLHPGLRIFHNLSAAFCFAFIVYIIQRYIEQRDALAVNSIHELPGFLLTLAASQQAPHFIFSRSVKKHAQRICAL